MAQRLTWRQIGAASTTGTSSILCRAFGSSNVSMMSLDPSRFVSGVTAEDLEKNPAMAAYFAANFPMDEPPRVVPHDMSELEDDRTKAKLDEGAGAGDVAQQAMNIRTLKAYHRCALTENGTIACNRLRYQRIIPGLLYGSDRTQNILSISPESKVFVKTPWNEIQRELKRYHRSFEGRVYDLTLFENEEDTEGTVHRVMPRDVQRHPTDNKAYCVNYLRYFPGKPIHLPIVYINEEESSAMKRGGFIAPISRTLECIVEEGVPIPEHLELECAGARFKEVMRMDRIIFPDGVKASKNVNKDTFLVGTVFGKKGSDEDEETAAPTTA
eukprot:scaffold2747_cov51-Attheya_sp.AAC.7